MIIDAQNLIAGRMATFVAKRALLGEKIDIVNVEKAIIVGPPINTLKAWKQRADRGIPSKGPHIKRRPDMILRRIIRGMLPYKQEKGRKAYENIICHIGVPESLQGKKFETIKEADMSRLTISKYITIEEISRHLGVRS